MSLSPEVTARLADRTLWTVADIAREVGMSGNVVAQYAFDTLRGGRDPSITLPVPVSRPSCSISWTYLTELRRVARGEKAADELRWAAGDVLLWALRCARLDHNLQPVHVPRPRIRRRS